MWEVVNTLRPIILTWVGSYLELITVENRRYYFLGCLIYQLINTGVPSYLSSKILPYVNNSHRVLRDRNLTFQIPFARLEIFRGSFSVLAPRFWNILPITIRTARSLTLFKLHLKTYLMTHNPDEILNAVTWFLVFLFLPAPYIYIFVCLFIYLLYYLFIFTYIFSFATLIVYFCISFNYINLYIFLLFSIILRKIFKL